MGEQSEHTQQQQDEHEDEGQRQDEGVQVWRADKRSGRWTCPTLYSIPFYTPAWDLTTSGQQRRRLRPGAPKAIEAGLRHTRTYHEGVTCLAPQVAQYALSAAIQDLHLGTGPSEMRGQYGLGEKQRAPKYGEGARAMNVGGGVQEAWKPVRMRPGVTEPEHRRGGDLKGSTLGFGTS